MMLRGYLPALAIVLMGSVVGRLDHWKHQPTMQKLIHYIFLPCLCFSSIHKRPFYLSELLLIGSAVSVITGIMILLCRGWSSRARGEGSPLVGVIFMSSGTVLLPLAYLLFGNEGLAKALYFHLFVTLLYHLLGARLLQGRSDLKGFFRTPFVYLLALGAVAAAVPVPVPEALQELAWLSEKGIEITAMGALPLLLISFGYPLGLLHRSDASAGLGAGLLRIVAGPVLALLVVCAYRSFGLLAMERGYDVLEYLDRRTTEAIIVLGAAMPAAHHVLRLDPVRGLLGGRAERGVFLVSAAGCTVTVAVALLVTLTFIFVD